MAGRESLVTETRDGLRLDQPLKVGDAIKKDALSRTSFARSAAEVLGRVSADSGVVVSLEGAWGSGKTSLLAMLEELLLSAPERSKPVVVHFNPWLIGDRDALLRQFLASVAKEVGVGEYAKDGRRVAKELKTYSKAFDVLKLIPGAEPWASMVKAVVESMGDATEAVFEYKTPDIEKRKLAVENALRKFSRRIVVLIDDLDRLFPADVFEMVRIVKAVGDLPNVGYVLAWDASYVSSALEKLNVPSAAAYLDKIVQVRLPIPPLSLSMRIALMDANLNRLPPDSVASHFRNGDERHAMLFHHGLGELMEQPRDVVRLFDVVRTIEPGLRGEVHLADIIGLAAMMTKAPKVYELLQRNPQAFVGRRPGARLALAKAEEVIAGFKDAREGAIDACAQPSGVRELVHWLFPQVAKADDAFTFDRVVFTEGHLAHPERLLIALQLSARPDDVSLVRVQQFLLKPDKRETIAQALEHGSCLEFLGNLGDVAESLRRGGVNLDVEDLSLAMARLADSDVVVRRASERNSVWSQRPETVATRALAQIAAHAPEPTAHLVAERLISEAEGLSVAAEIAIRSYWVTKEGNDFPL
jgi:hypothetical protein